MRESEERSKRIRSCPRVFVCVCVTFPRLPLIFFCPTLFTLCSIKNGKTDKQTAHAHALIYLRLAIRSEGGCSTRCLIVFLFAHANTGHSHAKRTNPVGYFSTSHLRKKATRFLLRQSAMDFLSVKYLAWFPFDVYH